MPLVVAIVPDADEAVAVSAILRELGGVELLIGDSTRGLVGRLGERTPDLVLMSPLIPASDEALISALLRQRGSAAAHVQIITIPQLDVPPPAAPSGLLFSSIRARPAPPTSGGCPPEAFALQLREYLELASSERRRLDAIASRQPPAVPENPQSDAPEDAA